jgi:hypothetical protein
MDLNGPVTATNDPMSITDTNLPAAIRLYRVWLLNQP